jgi:hypothetical protein
MGALPSRRAPAASVSPRFGGRASEFEPARDPLPIPPLDRRRRDFHEALLDADEFEDLPGRRQAAIVSAEQSGPTLRVVSGD